MLQKSRLYLCYQLPKLPPTSLRDRGLRGNLEVVRVGDEVMLYEHRKNTKRSNKVQLVQMEDIAGKQGYVSCYGFPEDTAALVEEQGGTYGLDSCPLYSDLLYIDIDDDVGAIETTRVRQAIQRLGLQYKLYRSGSPDSYHFHIPTVSQVMVGLPSLHLLWIKQTLGKDALVDFSIYKTSGIIKIAGASHKMHPGAFKELIDEVTGDVLDLTNFSVKYEPMITRAIQSLLAIEDRESILDRWLYDHVYEGGRNIALFKRAAMAVDIGMDKYTVEDMLDRWNKYYCHPPIQGREFDATVRSAWRGR
jgi:hypothetical protein